MADAIANGCTSLCWCYNNHYSCSNHYLRSYNQLLLLLHQSKLLSKLGTTTASNAGCQHQY